MSEKERLQLENELLMTCSKAQAINKYIDELEESSKLSELWCKSQEKVKNLEDKLNTQRKYYQNRLMKIQQENEQLQQRIDKAIEYIKHSWWLRLDQVYNTSKDLKGWEVEQLLEILKGDSNE